MFRISRMTCAAAFAGIALTLAGCGGGSDGGSEGEEPKSKGLSSLSADDLLDKATDELEAAPSFTISGQVEDEDGLLDMDMTFEKSGDFFGTIGIEQADVEMRVVGEDFYMKASNEFWALIGEEDGDDEATISGLQDMMGDRWITLDAADAAEQFDGFDRDGILEEFVPDGDVSIGDSKTIDGVKCLALEDSTGTLYVDAKTGRPVQVFSDEDGSVAKISYDEAKSPGAPEDALDIGAMAG